MSAPKNNNQKTNRAPRPLTTTPNPALNWSRAGTPASDDFDDIYFSTDGGLAETSAVFLQGCHLEQNWQNLKRDEVYTIGELGFGSGLNFLASLDLWVKTKADRAEQTRLHFISVEAFPWTRSDLQTALAHWPDLAPYVQALLAQWPGQVRGVHHLHFSDVSLTLFHMEVDQALNNMVAQVNAWFLDGFSPSKNPDMWADLVMEALASLSAPQANLATFSVAGFVRENLTRHGFVVEKKTGFGRKRHRLAAVYAPDAVPTKTIVKRPALPPIILGAGIAGASLALAYERRGIQPILIDPCLNDGTDYKGGHGASFNPGALVMPRLDLQDRPEARFFNAAYLYALARYNETETILQMGITQRANSAKEAQRFEKLLHHTPLPSSHMRAVPSDVEDRNALWFEHALFIDPKATIGNWTGHCQIRAHAVSSIDFHQGHWRVIDSGGETMTGHLHVCVGANVLDLTDLSVRFTKGQICWKSSAPDIRPPNTQIGDGYVCPYQDGVLLGASHHHVGAGQDNKTDIADTRELVATYIAASQIDPIPHHPKSWQTQASVRVTTKDTLPICAKISSDNRGSENGYYVLSGLGSRGFMLAPLLGELQVAQALGENLPVARNVLSRFGIK